LPDNLQTKFAAARNITSGLVVLDRLLRPHPVIAKQIEEHRQLR
jgi:hypothetical protein